MSLPRGQLLALRAALLAGDEATAAWREWRATTELDTIDRGTARLLPLLWHNLLALGVEDRWLPRMKGVYRHAWFANQVWMRSVREIEALLRRRGVEPIALKGIALANAVYPNPGLRPMDDLDLLVAPAEVSTALAALLEAGWRAPMARPELVLGTVHGVELRSADGQRLDLHGHLFQGSLAAEIDARRRARSAVLALPDGPLRVLEPTDQLLHVLVHGVESDPPAPRWLADALLILRARRDRLDWTRMFDDAAGESRSLALSVALAELVAVFGQANVPLPAEVVGTFAGRRWSLTERVEHRVAAGPRLFGIGYFVQRVVDWRRWGRSTGADRDAGFVGYMRLNWGLASVRAMPAQALRRGLRSAAADLVNLAGRLASRLRGAPAGDGESPSRA